MQQLENFNEAKELIVGLRDFGKYIINRFGFFFFLKKRTIWLDF